MTLLVVMLKGSGCCSCLGEVLVTPMSYYEPEPIFPEKQTARNEHLFCSLCPFGCHWQYLQSQNLDGSISSRFIVLYMSGYSRTERSQEYYPELIRSGSRKTPFTLLFAIKHDTWMRKDFFVCHSITVQWVAILEP